jgi:hypothetical protein
MDFLSFSIRNDFLPRIPKKDGNRFRDGCHLGTQRRLDRVLSELEGWADEALERSPGGGKDKVSIHSSHSLHASFRYLASDNRSEMGAV